MAERDPSTEPPDGAATETGSPDEPQPWGAGAAALRAWRRRRAVWIAAASVFAVAAIAVAWPAVESLVPRAVTDIFSGGETPPDPALAGLAIRIEALESTVAGLDGRIAAAAATAGAAMPHSEAARLGGRISALETRPAPRPPPPDARIAPLVERVDALASRVAALAAAPPSVARAPAEGALARLEARIVRLEAALEKTGDPELAGRVQAAGARVDGMEAELKRLAAAERTRKGDALLLAVGQLRAAASGPRPFEAELRLVREAAGGDAGMAEAAEPLVALAPGGVPTRAALESEFPALAVRAAQAALAPEDGDWLDRTAARLSRVVTIRRVGEGVEDGEGALAVIARAEVRLAAGDLAAAAHALDTLDGAPALVFGDWRRAAAARAATDAALARLGGLAVARFAAGGTRGGGG